MREIKFRAWVIDAPEESPYENNTMYDWDSVVDDCNWFIKCNELVNDDYDLKSFILMQYTGLLDKNGKEIYEGDIVYSTYYRHNIEIEDIFTMYKWFDYPESEEFEIIGNIYESKHLLDNTDTKV